MPRSPPSTEVGHGCHSIVTIKDVLAEAARRIQSDSARLDAELLLACALDKDRVYLYTWPEKIPTDEQLGLFHTLLERRIQGEPIAHILGKQEFWSLQLSVNAATLIPRPETECLVEWVLSKIDQPSSAELSLLDLGTGTGAIAIALASELPRSRITAADVSADAVRLAESNRVYHELSNMSCVQSNWYHALTGRFHFIVSNPPYIAPEDEHLQQGDLRFEPLSALVSEQNGLADLAVIIGHASQFLEENGWVVVEHGYNQHHAVQDMMHRAQLVNVLTDADYAGIPRITAGQKCSDSTSGLSSR